MVAENLKTVIDGFDCELDFSEEWSDCYVVKDNYSGTLEFLLSYGFLENNHSNQKNVSLTTINKIEKWALTNGY
jgi:hypothetical protein